MLPIPMEYEKNTWVPASIQTWQASRLQKCYIRQTRDSHFDLGGKHWEKPSINVVYKTAKTGDRE